MIDGCKENPELCELAQRVAQEESTSVNVVIISVVCVAGVLLLAGMALYGFIWKKKKDADLEMNRMRLRQSSMAMAMAGEDTKENQKYLLKKFSADNPYLTHEDNFRPDLSNKEVRPTKSADAYVARSKAAIEDEKKNEDDDDDYYDEDEILESQILESEIYDDDKEDKDPENPNTKGADRTDKDDDDDIVEDGAYGPTKDGAVNVPDDSVNPRADGVKNGVGNDDDSCKPIATNKNQDDDDEDCVCDDDDDADNQKEQDKLPANDEDEENCVCDDDDDGDDGDDGDEEDCFCDDDDDNDVGDEEDCICDDDDQDGNEVIDDEDCVCDDDDDADDADNGDEGDNNDEGNDGGDCVCDDNQDDDDDDNDDEEASIWDNESRKITKRDRRQKATRRKKAEPRKVITLTDDDITDIVCKENLDAKNNGLQGPTGPGLRWKYKHFVGQSDLDSVQPVEEKIVQPLFDIVLVRMSLVNEDFQLKSRYISGQNFNWTHSIPAARAGNGGDANTGDSMDIDESLEEC